jgi:hypothetical protein
MLVDEKRWDGKGVKQIWMVELIHGCGVVELMSSKESSPRRDDWWLVRRLGRSIQGQSSVMMRIQDVSEHMRSYAEAEGVTHVMSL